MEKIFVKAYNLFKLYVLDAEILDQVGKDTLDESAWEVVRLVGLHAASDSIVFQPADIM